eukprot:GEMP01010209.1.p1 GENE.GEMP01010209.1~~GEMP01010209.1.p1  ORF type:complete len:585 (+),score=145.74 GEMP01010209.1:156-1910(+)
MSDGGDGERRVQANEEYMEGTLLMNLAHTPGTVAAEDPSDDRCPMIFSNKSDSGSRRSPSFAKQFIEEPASTDTCEETTGAVPRECWSTSNIAGIRSTSNTSDPESANTSTRGIANSSAPRSTDPSSRDNVNTDAPRSANSSSRDIADTEAPRSTNSSLRDIANTEGPHTTDASSRDVANTEAPHSTDASSRDIANTEAQSSSTTAAPERLNAEVQDNLETDAQRCANVEAPDGLNAKAPDSVNAEVHECASTEEQESVNAEVHDCASTEAQESVSTDAHESASTEVRESGADSSTAGSAPQTLVLQPSQPESASSGRPIVLLSNRLGGASEGRITKDSKKCRPSISFARNPESSIQVDVVNCEEPGPSSPTKGARPVSESILRSGTKDLSQEASGRYLVSLPPCDVVTETQYFFTVADVAVREAARMQSKRVEIIRALTLIEPVDVNGPDKNSRRFLKLGYKRWVYDRAKTDGRLNIRQVLHFAGGFGFVVWSQQSLRAVLLDPEGPVQEWNNKQRAENLVHACIEINDFIVEVNGETKTTEMIRKLESNEPLQLRIRRDPPKLPETPRAEPEVKRPCCCYGF